ncbi:MAG: polyribonucleotide nucleotidyltransferase, partial [Candidatus Neomarinimicrobiota bacterium]
MIEVSREIGGRKLTIQTGKVAKQASGSVIVSYGESTIIAAVNAAKELREDIDFFPLQVEYRERHYAGGKIPGGFFKREARPSEREVLTSRVTDRPIRPLFPKEFRYETQVVITALTSDGENPTDTLAGIGASTALMISDIPWNGPIATVRVGLVDDEFVINPTRDQIEVSSLDLTVSGNENTIVMVEGEAEIVPEATVVEALKFAHTYIREIIDLEWELIRQVDVVKRPLPEVEVNQTLVQTVTDWVVPQLADIISIADKKERESATQALEEAALTEFADQFPEQEKQIKEVFHEELKKAFREKILSDGIRSDGRKTDEIRPITIDTGFLPRTHGSVLFTRGETQALVVLTLGTKSDEQIIDSMDEDYKKHYMLHYNFPPYCV